MGCPCNIQLYAESKDQALQAKEEALSRIEHLDAYYTNYSPDSFTAEINRSAGSSKGIKVDPETASLLDYAQNCYEQSDGLFDITAGTLRAAWDYQSTHPTVPSKKYLNSLLERVGWDKVNWQRSSLSLPIEGMNIDFGGVVKEYAADTASTLCQSNGIKYGLIDLGGDIAVIGPHPDGSPWIIGVRHPHQPETDIAVIRLIKGGLASSGNYERYFEIKGVRYGHILNPKTGWPVQGVSAVSVVAPQCLVAGSLATISMLHEGEDILCEAGIPYLLLDSKAKPIGYKDVYLTNSLQKANPLLKKGA
tara:strand:+ start:3048 stop:3965 length:918 start_codon:yes stop_codon:yes gene_type:complete